MKMATDYPLPSINGGRSHQSCYHKTVIDKLKSWEYTHYMKIIILHISPQLHMLKKNDIHYITRWKLSKINIILID